LIPFGLFPSESTNVERQNADNKCAIDGSRIELRMITQLASNVCDCSAIQSDIILSPTE